MSEKNSLKNNTSNKEASAYDKANEMEAGFVRTRKSQASTDDPKDSPKDHSVESSDNDSGVSNKLHVENKNKQADVKTQKTQKKSEKKEVFDIENDQFIFSEKIKKEGYQITLTPSLCTTVFITSVITLAFVFLFGFIMGKGMMNEPIVAESEKFNPNVQTESQNPESKPSGAVRVGGVESNKEQQAEILPKEDLKFLTTLKTESEVKPPTVEVDEVAENAKQNDSKQNNSNAEKPEEVKIIPTFDYNVRVAAFRKEDQADTLREKLEGAGFRTRKVIEKDNRGNWYFVHILMRAKEEIFKENIALIKKFAIRDYIIKEKKVVE